LGCTRLGRHLPRPGGLGQPHRVQLVGLWPAGDVPGRGGRSAASRWTLRPPAGRRLASSSCWWPPSPPAERFGCAASRPAPAARAPAWRTRGPPDGAALACPRGDPDTRHHRGLADVERTDPLHQLHRLFGLLHIAPLVLADNDTAARGASGHGQEPGSRAQGDNAGPPRRLPASDSLTALASARVSRRRRAASPISAQHGRPRREQRRLIERYRLRLLVGPQVPGAQEVPPPVGSVRSRRGGR
jgi:hypothetical protein